MILVLLSLKSAVAEADGMLTTKSVAFRFAIIFKLIPLDELLLLLLLLLLLFDPLLLVFTLGCSETLRLVGGLIPRLCFLSRLTCMMATSTTTSGLERSRSLISFSA